MKSIAKKALALLCAISMLFSLTVAVHAGPGDLTVTVGSVNAEPGTEVTVPVSISNNATCGDPDYPGITGLTLNITYDADVLAYKKATEGEALPGLDLTKPGKSFEEGNIKFNWDGTDSDNSDGEILLITFAVSEDAPGGDHAVNVIVVSACDYMLEDVETNAVSGKVTLPGGGASEVPEITTITVGSVAGAKPGDEIEVPVSIAGNDNGDPDYPGITGLTLNFQYDANVLAYKSAAAGEALPDLDLTKPGKTFTEGDLTFNWDGTDADCTDGEILVITFTVKEGANGGDHAIDLTVKSACDYMLEDIETVAVDGVVNVDAPEKPVIPEITTITVGSVTGAKPGDEIEVPVSIAGNDNGDPDYPGITGLTLNFKYDANILAYKNAAAGEALPGLDLTKPGKTFTEGDITFNWDGTDADCTDGEILVITFTVKEGASGGDHAVDLTVASACDYYLEDIETIAVDGTVNVDAPAHEHSYTEEITTAPTHTTDGVKTFTCSCGDTYTETIPANADDHEYDDGVVTTEPTCKEAGVKTFTCICGDSYTEAVPATGVHTWNDGEITTPATCNAEGVKTYTCTVCSETKTEAIPVDENAHIPGDWEKHDEIGHKQECTVCESILYTEAHEWDEGVVTTQPTIEAEGVMTYTCTVCGETKTEAIEKLPPAHVHSYVGEVTTPATHTQAGIKTYTCACGDSYTEEIPALVDAHEYDDGVVTLEPTHIATGIKTFTCICGDTYTEEIPALVDAHEYDNGVVTLEPTHTQAGIKTFTCICGDTYTEEIPALVDAHSYTGEVTLAPTHITAGIKTFTCICGDTYTEVIPALVDAHEYDNGVVTLEPTHTQAGIKTFTCICGDTYTEEIPALVDAHEYDDGVVTLEPTHIATGIKTFTCICGDTYEEEIPALTDAHEYDEGVVTKAPTHSEEGEMTFTCICGDTYTEVIEKIPHTFDSWVQYDNEFHKVTCPCGAVELEEHVWDDGMIARPATSTEDGIKLYTCTVCGRFNTEVIPATGTGGSTTGGSTTGGSTTGGSTTGGSTTGGSTTGGSTTGGTTTGGSTTGGGETGDGEVETCPHFYNFDVTLEPTHYATGIKTYTCVLCGDTYEEEIPAGEHAYGDWFAEGENHKKVCSCGDVITEEHTYDEEIVKEPTETESGVVKYTCSVCGHTKLGVIPATGTGDSTTGGSTTGGSTTGGSTTGGSTTGGSTTGGSTTGGSTTGGSTTGGSTTGGSTTGGSTTGGSTTGGSTTGGSTSGGTETDDPCETGHTWNDGVVTTPATCAADGIKTYTCTVCNEATYTEVIPATGEHAWDNGVVTTPATCVDEGIKTYTCTVCNEATYTEAIPATGEHAWDNGVETVPPTVTEDGVKTFTCAVCGATKTEAIEKLGPTSITVGSMAANEGDTIIVPVVLAKNYAGLCGLTLKFTYDERVLSYISAAKGEALPDLDLTKPGNRFEEGNLTFNWDGTDSDFTEGEILLITFRVADSLSTGDYAINVEVVTACDFDFNDIDVETVAGIVSVTGTAQPPHVHEYDNGVVTLEPTHTQAGIKTFTCICGDTYTEEIPALVDAHEYDDGVVTLEPTHIATGIKTFTCICGDTYTEEIPALVDAHEYDNGVVTLEPTHIATGIKTFTCICGDTYTEEIPALVDAHEYDDGVVTLEPTHIATGIKTFTCICGDTYTEEIPAIADAHEYGDWAKVDDDNHAKTCTCGDVVTEAHTWDEGVVTLEPTYTAEGVKTFTCSVCNGTKTEAIAKKVRPSSGGGGMSGRPSTQEPTEEPKDPTDDPKDPEEPTDPTDKPVNITNFGDVEENDWFYSAVEFAVNNNLMVGTTEDKFDPYMNTTRGMIITVLYRLEGSPAVEGEASFDDVDPNAYYADAVVWGQDNGIIYGFSETEYGPDVYVTREQLVAIKHRYAEFKGYDITHGDDVGLDHYDDKHHVSDWAEESMKYGVGSGLIYGRSESTLNPLDNATRAEFAAILKRFIEMNN